MQWSVDAIFTNGVFKPLRSVPLKEQERVHLDVQELPVGHLPANGEPESPAAPTAEGHHRLIEHLRLSPGYDLGGEYPARNIRKIGGCL
jgi:hypothetical protein